MQPSDPVRDPKCYIAGPVTLIPVSPESDYQMPHLSSMMDVRHALVDERFSHDVRVWLRADLPHTMALDATWATEGEEHARRRRLLHILLNRQAAIATVPTVEHLTIDRIRQLNGNTFDYAKLAYSVTLSMVLHMIGLPQNNGTWLAGHLRRYERHASVGNIEPEAPELREYFEACLRARRSGATQSSVNGPDLLDVLVAAKELSIQDACGEIMMFLAAGMGTTGTTAANTFGLVHEQPKLVETLRANLDSKRMVGRFVLEALRHHTAFSHGPTTVLEAHTLPSGTTIPAGPATLCFSAANRDPVIFHDPERYDPSRTNLSQQMGFGWSRHRCPGEHHGWRAAATIIATTHRYMVGLRPDPDKQWLSVAAVTDVVENAPALHDYDATLAGLPA